MREQKKKRKTTTKVEKNAEGTLDNVKKERDGSGGLTEAGQDKRSVKVE